MGSEALLGSIGTAALVSSVATLVQYFAAASSRREEVLLWVAIGAFVIGFLLLLWVLSPLRKVPITFAIVWGVEGDYKEWLGWTLRVQVEGKGQTRSYEATAEWVRPVGDDRSLDHSPWPLYWETSRGPLATLGKRVHDVFPIVHIDSNGIAHPVVHDDRTVHQKDLRDGYNPTEIVLTVTTPSSALRARQVRCRFVPDTEKQFALALVE